MLRWSGRHRNLRRNPRASCSFSAILRGVLWIRLGILGTLRRAAVLFRPSVFFLSSVSPKLALTYLRGGCVAPRSRRFGATRLTFFSRVRGRVASVPSSLAPRSPPLQMRFSVGWSQETAILSLYPSWSCCNLLGEECNFSAIAAPRRTGLKAGPPHGSERSCLVPSQYRPLGKKEGFPLRPPPPDSFLGDSSMFD